MVCLPQKQSRFIHNTLPHNKNHISTQNHFAHVLIAHVHVLIARVVIAHVRIALVLTLPPVNGKRRDSELVQTGSKLSSTVLSLMSVSGSIKVALQVVE